MEAHVEGSLWAAFDQGFRAALAAGPAEPEPTKDAGEYDFRHEAQRIIDAIEPRAGATMTLMCALREAYEAGRLATPASRAPGEPGEPR